MLTHTDVPMNTHVDNSVYAQAHTMKRSITARMLTSTHWTTCSMDTPPYKAKTHKSKKCIQKNSHKQMHATECTSIIICHSGLLSHIFSYLLIYLFVYSLFVELTLFLFARWVPRGEWENIHLLMSAVINSEQACLFLSLCQSVSFTLSISLTFCLFSRLSQYQPSSLSLSQQCILLLFVSLRLFKLSHGIIKVM